MDFIRVFKTLGDETRLRIVNILLQGKTPLCVCEMTDVLELPQYHISRHLMILKTSGLVEPERDGTWIYYHISPETNDCVNDLLGVIQKHFKKRFPDDVKRLKKRLSKREKGKCVIGFAQNDG